MLINLKFDIKYIKVWKHESSGHTSCQNWEINIDYHYHMPFYSQRSHWKVEQMKGVKWGVHPWGWHLKDINTNS